MLKLNLVWYSPWFIVNTMKLRLINRQYQKPSDKAIDRFLVCPVGSLAYISRRHGIKLLSRWFLIQSYNLGSFGTLIERLRKPCIGSDHVTGLINHHQWESFFSQKMLVYGAPKRMKWQSLLTLLTCRWPLRGSKIYRLGMLQNLINDTRFALLACQKYKYI